MNRSIRALLFDFDGLILDTETPEFDVWTRIYAEHGFVYPADLGRRNVGFWGSRTFDPVAHLHELTHDSFDMDALRKRHSNESAVLIEAEPVRPGVLEYMASARRLGLRLAVASSSPRAWVESHLSRLGLVSGFDHIITADDVPAGRTKPHPDIYLKALEVTEAAPGQAIALEDSPPGLAAARAAGIYAVAVPNSITMELKLDEADMVLDSLAILPLEELIRRASAPRTSPV
jgi:HAD superfamily hydrolase (TIGR01509 family)